MDFISLIKMPTIMGPNISTQHLLFFSLQNNTGGTGAPQWRRQERPFWQMKCLEAAEVPPADIEYSRVCSSERPMDEEGNRKGRMTGGVRINVSRSNRRGWNG